MEKWKFVTYDVTTFGDGHYEINDVFYHDSFLEMPVRWDEREDWNEFFLKECISQGFLKGSHEIYSVDNNADYSDDVVCILVKNTGRPVCEFQKEDLFE